MRDQIDVINRRWRLARRPEGTVRREDFILDETPLAPPLGQGKLLLRHELLLCAPTIRNWISGRRESYYPTIEIGDPILAPAASRILFSDDPAWPVGALVVGLGTWQDYEWVSPEGRGLRVIPDGISSRAAMGLFGMNALTITDFFQQPGSTRPLAAKKTHLRHPGGVRCQIRNIVFRGD